MGNMLPPPGSGVPPRMAGKNGHLPPPPDEMPDAFFSVYPPALPCRHNLISPRVEYPVSMSLKTLLVTPAGKEKVWDVPGRNPPDTLRAADAFTGRFARRCAQYARIHYPKDWVILSPNFGYLLPDDEVRDYRNDEFGEYSLEFDTICENAEYDGLLGMIPSYSLATVRTTGNTSMLSGRPLRAAGWRSLLSMSHRGGRDAGPSR
ncbi:hypothetical protein [Methanogenium cariaci]|uniref:hypothetical protein n=1 Tax=Methanogenium cariaci TaxID=2197 RepID=UPI0007850B87|nr:hypothetical protein [Methanogenium cariaci]